MRAAAIAGFLAAIFPLIATPGASLTLLVREVSAAGRGRAVPVILGTVTGLYLHATLAIAGLSELVMHSSQAFEAVRIIGAVYLIGLGVQTWRSTRSPLSPPTVSPPTVSPPAAAPARAVAGSATGHATYRQALLGNVLNPKAASIFLTVVPQFVNPAHPLPAQVLTLATAQAALVAAWLAGWALLLGSAARFSSSARASQLARRLTATVLVGLGLRSALA
jgi:threonine/homoserine/homoserine lactone efflux protein